MTRRDFIKLIGAASVAGVADLPVSGLTGQDSLAAPPSHRGYR